MSEESPYSPWWNRLSLILCKSISRFIRKCTIICFDFVHVFYSKRLRLDDNCNNNLNSTLNSASKTNEKWSRSGDTSLVEPEILEDMGVSMLEDEASHEGARKSQSQGGPISPTGSDTSRQRETVVNTFESQQNIYRGSNFDTVLTDRCAILNVRCTYNLLHLVSIFLYNFKTRTDPNRTRTN